ncbi:hypothetical protein [Legionella bozemanae]|uniref:hypothetical protein n=1 Tax=Legionella bozemanae TaxID=447 RepID=UPI0010413B44|nr:hypothetical protein [Legionella bozemanae]
MYKKQLISSLLGFLVADILFANEVATTSSLQNFYNNYNNYWHAGPWTSRFTSQGLISRSELAGFVDGMIPVLGQSDRLVYVDGAFMGGRNQSMVASMGTGIRSIHNIQSDEIILGGFFFADYQRMNLMNNQLHTWIANPGLELLTKHHEARVQGYFPMGKRSQPYLSMMASNMPQFVLHDSGKTNIAQTSGHTFIDAPVSLTHEYGVGVEGEVGRYIPIAGGVWLRGGVYHFDYHNAPSVNGWEANIEVYAGKNISLLVQDNYDNQNKNWFSFGVRLSFGGPDYTQVNQLRNRMEEPIIRHIARQPSGAAIPIRESYILTGPTQIINDIWFFSPSGTNYTNFNSNICTAEHPCQTLNQSIADGITATVTRPANLWFASGNYTLPANNGSQVVYLGNGQILSGRSADFTTSATLARPIINGGLWWYGNGSFQDINIINSGQINVIDNSVAALGADNNLTVNNASVVARAQGVTVNGIESDNLSVTNAVISAEGDQFVIAASALNAINVTNSELSALGTDAGQIFGVIGNQLATPVNVVVRNSNIKVVSTGDSSFVLGVWGINTGTVIVDDSVISAIGPRIVVGVDSDGGDVEVNRSSIYSEGGDSLVNGIFAQGSIRAQEVNITARNNSTGESLGIVNNMGDVFLTDSTINSFSTAIAYGISANGGNVFSTNNIIFAQSSSTIPGRWVLGIYANQNATINSSKVTAQNISTAATGVTQGIVSDGVLTFEGGESSVSATSSTPASSDAVIGAEGVINNSNPKSQCSINGGASADCA